MPAHLPTPVLLDLRTQPPPGPAVCLASTSDGQRPSWDYGTLFWAMKVQEPEVPIGIVLCGPETAEHAALVAGGLMASRLRRPFVVGVLEVAEGLWSRRSRRAAQALAAKCPAVIIGDRAETEAAIRAIVAICAPSGWVASHPEDVAGALRGCRTVAVGTASGDRADLTAMTERVLALREFGRATNLLVHLEVADASDVLFDLDRIVTRLTGGLEREGEVVWGYSVRVGAPCTVTALVARPSAVR